MGVRARKGIEKQKKRSRYWVLRGQTTFHDQQRNVVLVEIAESRGVSFRKLERISSPKVGVWEDHG